MDTRKLVVGWTALVVLAVWLLGCGSFFANQNTTISFPLYVANAAGGNISAFKLDPNSGALSAVSGSPFTAGAGPSALGINSTGVFLYSANLGSAGANGGVSGWTVNPDGTLTPMSGSPFASTSSFASIAVDSQARYVFAGSSTISPIGGTASTIQRFTVSAATGVLTTPGLAPTTGVPVRMTEDPAGRFLYVAEGSSGVDVFTTAANGALTNVQNVPLPAANGVAATSSTVYVADGTDGVLAYSINGTTGQLTAIGSALPAGTGPSDIAVTPSGAFVFVVNGGSNDVSAYAVGASGALTAVSGSPVAAGTGPTAVAVDPSSRYVYVTNKSGSVSIFTIGSSGQLTPAGTANAGSSPNDVVVVPLQ